LVSKKTKVKIAGFIGCLGFLISLCTPFVLLGLHFGQLKFTVAEEWVLFTLLIGIVMATSGIGYWYKVRIGIKERIADFASPILKSRGKVSLREIATHLKMDADILAQEEYLEKMIKEGYFEDTRLEGAWLVRDVIPCRYCGGQVRLTERKCPNCGASIKK
jgi:hypothetical protein